MKHLLITLSLLLAGLSLTGQREITIQSSVLGSRFVKAHILTHNADNELVDMVTLQPPIELPKYLTVKAPGRDTFHTITIILVRDPDEIANRQYNIQLGTIWDNQQDTVSTFPNFNVQPPIIKTGEKQKINLTIKNVGKLDDLYSPALGEDIFESARKEGANYIIALEAFAATGRTIFVVNKKDKKYRQIILPPDLSGALEASYTFDYRELSVHKSRKTIHPSINTHYNLLLSANDEAEREYHLYYSPRGTYQNDEEIFIDLPEDFPVKTYNAFVSVSDAPTSNQVYTVFQQRQKLASIEDIQFPELPDKYDFITTNGGDSYTVDLTDKPFESWSLFYPIQGYVNPGTGGSDIVLQNSWWSIDGTAEGTPQVYLPQLPAALMQDLWGNECRVKTEQDNWMFSVKDSNKKAFARLQFRWHLR